MSHELAKTDPKDLALTAIPDYMLATDGDTGMGDLQQYIIPPRIKVVQKQASAELLAQFGTGALILSPQGSVVTPAPAEGKTGAPFYFTPILFFPEWGTLNPFQMKGSLPMFRVRTRDPKHPVVAKAKNPDKWLEPCPENTKHNCRNCEFLNFLIVMYGEGEYAGVPVMMSFSRGDYRSGANLAALITLRCNRNPKKKAKMYGCRFRGQAQWRPGTGAGDFFGIDVMNPTAEDVKMGMTPFVPPDVFEQLHAIATDMGAKKDDIVVEHDDDILEGVSNTVDDGEM